MDDERKKKAIEIITSVLETVKTDKLGEMQRLVIFVAGDEGDLTTAIGGCCDCMTGFVERMKLRMIKDLEAEETEEETKH